jgi:hypothetical protein
MKNISITDVTLMALPQVSQKAALDFCRLTLGMGAAFVEMPPVLYRRIEGGIDPRNISLRISSLDEYVHFKGRGLGTFSADKNAIKSIFGENPVGGTEDRETCGDITAILSADYKEKPTGSNQRNIAFRLCGFEEVMLGDYSLTFSALIKSFGKDICIDPYDARYTAAAAALEFIYSGGTNVCTSFCGLGGHAATEQLMESFNVMDDAHYNLTDLPRLRAVCESMTRRSLPGNLPVAGRSIFVYESGIHADGIGKNPVTYEPFDPVSVGASRILAVGKHSGRAAIRQKLLEMGLMPIDGLLTSLNEEVRVLSEKRGRGLSDDEFLGLYNDIAQRN